MDKEFTEELAKWIGVVEDDICQTLDDYELETLKKTALHFANWQRERDGKALKDLLGKTCILRKERIATLQETIDMLTK